MAENGTVAKILALRKNYFSSVQAVLDTVNSQLSQLQSKYLDSIVDITLDDPALSEIQRMLRTKLTFGQPIPIVPSPIVGEERIYTDTIHEGLITTGKGTEDATPIGQSGDPEKFPLKTRRVRAALTPKRCPACRSQILEQDARFCSKCAAPLPGLFR